MKLILQKDSEKLLVNGKRKREAQEEATLRNFWC
jgi:hypothetical protein